MIRPVKILVILLMFVTVAAGCRTMTGQSLGTIVDDSTTAASIKSKLTAEKFQNLTWVGVDVENGLVTLSGNAESEIQKQRAENIARNTTGVRGVVNTIMVTPKGVAHAQEVRPPAQAGMQPSAQAGTAQQPGVQQPGMESQAPAASPAAREVLARQTVTGEISDINRGTGLVRLTTPEGRMDIAMPRQAVENVREGDRVVIDLVIRSTR